MRQWHIKIRTNDSSIDRAFAFLPLMTIEQRKASSASDDNMFIWSARGKTTDVRESRVTRAYELLLRQSPGFLLDVGCGDGSFGEPLTHEGWSVVGVDQVPTHLRTAAMKLSSVICADVSQGIPVRPGSFDAAFAGEVIEHQIDTDAFMGRIWNALRPGGLFVLTTPNLASLENRMRLVFGLYPMWVDYRIKGHGHVRAYTPRVLIRQLAENGFQVVHHVGNWVPFLPQRLIDDLKLPWLSVTGKWAPSLSMDTVIGAIKIEKGTNEVQTAANV